eukprot:CAMPEP_0197826904 /NCGR_PEP_ID=MMETSP1437-20131217/3791_1 /TAXON_ID=49252 ORGANISM="Eucampia antarctica, Strain CCMP1452" /NCGR_SAMPLE_ID=MMETSP1437 /ASSEMBLY_ACC=CAM_ASM_001096 /LENGTH=234 /DNA_ID=CAMNT_0043427543 /DNA_START=300 /DNA_END=1005 /DNA_ORIENTATION=+
MQSADTCILYDSDWNPQPDLQAMARVHRIGQKKIVHVYRLVTGQSIEEMILKRAEKKLYLDQMVTRGSVQVEDEGTTSLNAEELLASLRFGCNAVFGESAEKACLLPTDKDIEALTDRNRSENFSCGILKGGVTHTAKDFDATEKLLTCAHFGGVNFKAIQKKLELKNRKNLHKNVRNITDQWGQVAQSFKRTRKSRIVMLDGLGSGYGSASVPVLSANNYELQNGESSSSAEN